MPTSTTQDQNPSTLSQFALSLVGAESLDESGPHGGSPSSHGIPTSYSRKALIAAAVDGALGIADRHVKDAGTLGLIEARVDKAQRRQALVGAHVVEQRKDSARLGS